MNEPDFMSREEELGARELFRDAIFNILRGAARSPGVELTAPVAEALREFFVVAPITVVSVLHDTTHATTARGSGACVPSLDEPARVLSPREIKRCLPVEATRRTASGAVLEVWQTETEDAWVLGIARTPRSRAAEQEQRLYIVLEAGAEAAVSPDWLASYHMGLEELFITLEALQMTRRLAELERKIDSVISQRSEVPFERLLRRASQLVDQLVFEIGVDDPQQRYLGLTERFATWIAQRALGTGWLSGPQQPHDVEAIGQLAHGLWRAAALATSDGAEPNARAISSRLRLIALMLHTDAMAPAGEAPRTRDPYGGWLQAMQTTHPSVADTTCDWWLLAAWTGVHRMVSSATRGSTNPTRDLDQLWATLCQQSLPLMERQLSDMGDSLGAPQLALWFAVALLPETSSDAEHDTPVRRWVVRTSLAWVVRESLRRLVQGDRADFRWEPERYAEAMFDLIELHGSSVLGLGLDVRGVLTTFDHLEGTLDQGLISGHRQHVIEVYLSGQFLLDLQRTQPDGSHVRVTRMLGGGSTGLRRAFALAALHHDLGALVLARLRDTAPWSDHLALPAEARETIASHRRKDCASLLKRCELEVKDSRLLEHLADRAWTASDGHGDHALVSAWMLLHLGRDAEVPDEMLAPALRAILLHGDVTAPIDLARDPAAAVLVLCDQLFEWEPTAAGWAPHSQPPGPSPRDLPPRSRARALRVAGLQLSHEDGHLQARIAQDEAWPAFTIELHHPDLLHLPTWQIWLSMSQCLGRIGTAEHGWRPRILLKSELASGVAEQGLHTYAQLDRLANLTPAASVRPLAMKLRKWLTRGAAFQWDLDARTEQLTLHPLVYKDDVRVCFADLAEAFAERWED